MNIHDDVGRRRLVVRAAAGGWQIGHWTGSSEQSRRFVQLDWRALEADARRRLQELVLAQPDRYAWP